MNRRPSVPARLVIKQEDIDRGALFSWSLEVQFVTRSMEDMVRIVEAVKHAANEELARELP